MTKEEIEELKGLAASMGLYDDKNPCKRAVILGKAIEALKKKPSISEDGTLTVNVEDGSKVSRVLVCGDNHFGGLYYPDQEPKTGHWIRVDKDKLRCSECEVIHLIAQYPNGKIDWCPNCGAKMQGRRKHAEEVLLF